MTEAYSHSARSCLVQHHALADSDSESRPKSPAVACSLLHRQSSHHALTRCKGRGALWRYFCKYLNPSVLIPVLKFLLANPIKLGFLCISLEMANIQSMARRSVYFSIVFSIRRCYCEVALSDQDRGTQFILLCAYGKTYHLSPALPLYAFQGSSLPILVYLDVPNLLFL